MSFYSSLTHSLYSNSYTHNSPQKGFNKNKELNQLFLNKNTIIKRIQKLMLEVKDLDTKMFLSKTITYIDQNIVHQLNAKPQDYIQESHPKEETHKNETNKEENKENNLDNTKQSPTKPISHLFSNHLSEIKPSQTNHNMDISMMIPTQSSNAQISTEIKGFAQTATSQGFINSTSGFKQKEPSVIQETLSETGTLHCDCGLLSAFLQMVSQLMEKDIVTHKSQKQTEFLEVDSTLINQITQQILTSWDSIIEENKTLRLQYQGITETVQQIKESHENELSRQAENLTLRNQQNIYLREEIEKITLELDEANRFVAKYKDKGETLIKELSNLDKEIVGLREGKVSLEEKLNACTKNLEKALAGKLLVEETKNLEIDSMKLEIELKDNQIGNLQTIIQTLEKQTKEYGTEIELLRRSQASSQKSISSPLSYPIDIEALNSQLAVCVQPVHDQIKEEVLLDESKKMKEIKLENEMLKQECLLLYEQINRLELFS